MPDFLPGGEPFFLEGNRTGCLLVHGFTGTPYEMRGLGEFLHQQLGCTVFGPVLAGHSTSPEEMACTTWQDWYGTVRAAYDQLRNRCDRVFAIGLSLGGSLVLHLAAELSEQPEAALRGIVAVAAPAYIKHPLIFWFRNLPILFRLVPYIGKNPADDDTQDPTVRANHPSYDRTPTLCARSLILDFLPRVAQELASIQVPTLLLQSRGDKTIPADSMPFIYSRLGSKEKEMVWLERGGHLVLEDYDKARAFGLAAEFISRSSAEPERCPLPSPSRRIQSPSDLIMTEAE